MKYFIKKSIFLCLSFLLVTIVASRFATSVFALTVTDSMIFYDSNKTGNFEIYAQDLNTGVETRLTTDTNSDSWWPRISPDRTRLLFYKSPKGTYDRDNSKNNLWVLNTSDLSTSLVRAVGTDGWAVQAHAEWSPDGTKLVMFGGSSVLPQIYTQTISGSNVLGTPMQISNRNVPSYDPSWSPDGTKIVFVSCITSACPGTSYDVYVMPSGGGTETNLTGGNVVRQDDDPYFSPDGAKITWEQFQGGYAGGVNIQQMNADGSSQQALTGDLVNVNTMPTWSRDGTQIYFMRATTDTNRFGLYKMPTGGGTITQVMLDPNSGVDTGSYPNFPK